MKREVGCEISSFALKNFKGIEPLWAGFIVTEKELYLLCPSGKKNETTQIAKSLLTEEYWSLVKDTIRILARQCKAIASADFNSQQIARILRDHRPYIRAATLLNEKCSADHVAALLADESSKVAIFAAHHERVKMLGSIPVSKIQLHRHHRSVSAALMRNENCPPKILKCLVEKADDESLADMALNPKLPQELFDILSLKNEGDILLNLIKNPGFPKDLIERLAFTADPTSRSELASRSDIDLKILGRLSMDIDLRVRAVASNRLNELLTVIRLTDWCSINIGVTSPRVSNLVTMAIEKLSPMGWMVILADFLRRVFTSNTGDYLDMLERLATTGVASKVARSSQPIEKCPFLEASFRFLNKESTEAIFKSPWSSRQLNEWHERLREKQNYLPSIRSDLKNALRCSPIKDMSSLLKVASQVIDRKYEELNVLKGHLLPANLSLSYLTKVKLNGRKLAKYAIYIPSTLQELIDLGEVLKNCFRSRDTSIRYAHSSGGIIVLKDRTDGRVLYAVHLDRSGKILEMKGKCNKEAPSALVDQLQQAIRKVNDPRPPVKITVPQNPRMDQ